MEKEKMETRAIGEIRAIDEEGIIEAHLTRWDVVDSYNSKFTRGAFKKTFSERKDRIKLLWNHDVLIGKTLEAHEDDYGPFIRAKINLDTVAGKDAYAHLKAGDVTEMSFGFNVLQDKMVDNVRVISEIRCMEISPVLFPANEAAKIVSVRAEDFNDTVSEAEVMNRGWRLTDALMRTLEEIWWNTPDVSKIGNAIDDFKAAYTLWAEEYLTMPNRSIPTDNELSIALYRHCSGDLDTLAKETAFTMTELRTMAEGRTLKIEKRDKLAELSTDVVVAHQKIRSEAVKALCDELRAGGFDDQEMKQIDDLLKNKKPNIDISEMISSMNELRTGLTKEK